MATSEEKRVVREAIWKLAWSKQDCWQHVLRPAGVPWDVVRPYLDGRRGAFNAATGKPYTKYEAGPFIIDALEAQPDGEQVLSGLVRHIAGFSHFELARSELEARAVVEKAKDLLPMMETRIAEGERAASELAARIKRQQQEEDERRDRERNAALAQRRALLLAEYDEMQRCDDHSGRGTRLEYVFQALFDLEGIAAWKSFKRNEAMEQVDGGFRWDGRYVLIQVKWLSSRVSDSDVEYARSQVGRSGADLLLFLSVNGWTESLMPLLKQNPDKNTVLMNGYELRCVLAGQVTMRTVIQRKLDALKLHSEPFVQVTAEDD